MNQYERIHHQLLKDIENGKRVSPLKVIRSFCLECMGYQRNEVEDCQGDTAKPGCPLFRFRFGRNKTGKNPSKRK